MKIEVQSLSKNSAYQPRSPLYPWSWSLQILFLFISGLAQVVFGQHHVMLLDNAGKVYSLGRHDYGVLGQGEGLTSEVKVPTQVLGDLEKEPCYEIACGSAVSYALTTSGTAYSWGMCTNLQLAHAEEEDALVPTKMLGKQLATNQVIGVSSGGQHTLLLAKAKPE